MLTLQLYWLWGQIPMRQYVWRHILIGETPLHWAGSTQSQRQLQSAGGRLLCAVWLLCALCHLFNVLHVGPSALVHPGVAGLLTLLGIGMAPLLQYQSWGYQLRETSWRGVAFGLEGDMVTYAKVYLGGALWALLTLGLGYGSFAVRTRDYLINNSRWGDLSFGYHGSVGEVRRLYVLGSLACVLTLGAYLPWHVATLRQYHGSKTTLGPLRLQIFQEGSSLSNLWLQNLLIYIGTLGLGAAWAKSRSIRYQMEHMAVLGPKEALQPGPAPQGPKDGLIDFISMGGDRLFGA
jgi:uncharacterized membrane protein YjgN (DUF898 family)